MKKVFLGQNDIKYAVVPQFGHYSHSKKSTSRRILRVWMYKIMQYDQEYVCLHPVGLCKLWIKCVFTEMGEKTLICAFRYVMLVSLRSIKPVHCTPCWVWELSSSEGCVSVIYKDITAGSKQSVCLLRWDSVSWHEHCDRLPLPDSFINFLQESLRMKTCEHLITVEETSV